MNHRQLGEQLTAAQDALDAAGRLVALQQRATLSGGRPSTDVEQRLTNALRAARSAAELLVVDVDRYLDQPTVILLPGL